MNPAEPSAADQPDACLGQPAVREQEQVSSLAHGVHAGVPWFQPCQGAKHAELSERVCALAVDFSLTSFVLTHRVSLSLLGTV